MNNGIIGFTGFVGSNLINQFQFDEFYNSQNIESIIGKKFDTLVCSGAPAAKWKANQEPVRDKQNLQRLIDCLQQVSTEKLILISSVDVYNLPVRVDEDTAIDLTSLHPYGKHRRELELVAEGFPHLIVRLPGLFGTGIKKNIIYDFLHQNLVDKIHQDSVFQFYNLAHLWQDMQKAIANDIQLINFATEPTSVKEVAAEAFGFEFNNVPDSPPASYDLHSKYAEVWGNSSGKYLYSKPQVLLELKEFVRQFASV